MNELGRAWKEVVVAFVKVLPWNFLGGTEESPPSVCQFSGPRIKPGSFQENGFYAI
jgi:hypothetical protein